MRNKHPSPPVAPRAHSGTRQYSGWNSSAFEIPGTFLGPVRLLSDCHHRGDTDFLSGGGALADLVSKIAEALSSGVVYYTKPNRTAETNTDVTK